METNDVAALNEVVKTASVRDLVMLRTYGKYPYVTRKAQAELTARGLCRNCGSASHTYCNANGAGR